MKPSIPLEPKGSRELIKTPQATVMTKEHREIFQALTSEQKNIFRGIKAEREEHRFQILTKID